MIVDLLFKGIPNLKSVFAKQTQNAHLCHTKSFSLIKQREVKLWADQVYFGQPVSSHMLLDFFSATSCLW